MPFTSPERGALFGTYPVISAAGEEVHLRNSCKNVDIGGVLLQVQEGRKELAVALFSKIISNAEKYCVVDAQVELFSEKVFEKVFCLHASQ
jgi:hypothetical protein